MFAGFVFEDAQSHAGLANGDPIRLDRFDFIHAHEVEDHSAVERNSLAVVSRSRSAECDRDIPRVAVAEHILYLSGVEGLHDDFAVTAIMMTVDPTTVRMKQRVAADKFRINGVELAPAEKTIEWGRKIVDFRAEATVKAIKAAPSAFLAPRRKRR